MFLASNAGSAVLLDLTSQKYQYSALLTTSIDAEPYELKKSKKRTRLNAAKPTLRMFAPSPLFISITAFAGFMI
jgi:hypothetical protein